MTSADIHEESSKSRFWKNWCFHILKIISFLESVVFNHLDDTLTSVFSKIIGSNVRFLVSLSEILIKYSILSFRLELVSIGRIRQFLVLTHFHASVKYSHTVDRVFLTKTIFIRLFCVTVKIKSVVGNRILGVLSSENCVLYCSNS